MARTGLTPAKIKPDIIPGRLTRPTVFAEFAHEVMNLIHLFHHQLALGAERDVEQDLL